MSNATQVFQGVLFVNHPLIPRAFLRIDVLEQLFAEMITTIVATVPYPANRYRHVHTLTELQAKAASFSFPHDELFRREAERKGYKLNSKDYCAALVAAAAADQQRIAEGIPF
ncbi:hypothetical protein [Pseudomonas sichuanensis]|uniref:hypothetical protein n=1 Tax=Pseudomonas sichuanensis TaxID=2213015 RepID=UPI002AB8554F|nr:hypothetical protein [Pseudomonas sichuanensis]MDZ4017396.1 hypothetical protein [Pseudomonas sichuanensis]